MLTGKNLIGNEISGEGSNIFPSSIMVDETPTSHPFYEASEKEITTAVTLAHKAFASYRHLSPGKKASFLEKIAEGIASSKEELVKMAMHETNLPRPCTFPRNQVNRGAKSARASASTASGCLRRNAANNCAAMTAPIVYDGK